MLRPMDRPRVLAPSALTNKLATRAPRPVFSMPWRRGGERVYRSAWEVQAAGSRTANSNNPNMEERLEESRRLAGKCGLSGVSGVVHEQLAPKHTFAKKKATTMSQITCSQQHQRSVCLFPAVPTRTMANDLNNARHALTVLILNMTAAAAALTCSHLVCHGYAAERAAAAAATAAGTAASVITVPRQYWLCLKHLLLLASNMPYLRTPAQT